MGKGSERGGKREAREKGREKARKGIGENTPPPDDKLLVMALDANENYRRNHETVSSQNVRQNFIQHD